MKKRGFWSQIFGTLTHPAHSGPERILGRSELAPEERCMMTRSSRLLVAGGLVASLLGVDAPCRCRASADRRRRR